MKTQLSKAIFLCLFVASAVHAEEGNTIFQRMRIAHLFGDNAHGILIIDRDAEGQMSGQYTFPGEKYGNDLQAVATWKLQELKYEKNGSEVSVSYRIPLDLVGKAESVVVEFKGEYSPGVIDLSSDDGKLHCIESAKGLICLADMTPRFNDFNVDFANVAEHLTGKYEMEFDTQSRRAIVPVVRIEHHVQRDGVDGILFRPEVWIFGAANRTIETSIYFLNAEGESLKDTNGSFNTTNGNVSVGSWSTLPEDANIYVKTIEMFMPYTELETEVTNDKIRFIIRAWDVTDKEEDSSPLFESNGENNLSGGLEILTKGE